jgi:hypothetical protein
MSTLVENRNKSKYEAGSIIYLDDPPDYPDRITLGGVKPFGVPTVSDDGKRKESSVIQVSRGMLSRQPRMTDEAKAIRRERRFGTTIIPGVKGYKWCSACGDWVEVKGFSEDRRNHDGYQNHCKECRAAHARMVYWHQKNSAPPAKLPMAA